MTKNESKLLSIQGIAKASAFCLLLSAAHPINQGENSLIL